MKNFNGQGESSVTSCRHLSDFKYNQRVLIWDTSPETDGLFYLSVNINSRFFKDILVYF
jgi:hypothetical protein